MPGAFLLFPNLGNLRDNDRDLYKILKSKQVEILRKEIKYIYSQCWSPREAYPSILSPLI